MERNKLTKDHKELVEAIMNTSEKKITRTISGLHVMKGYLTDRDHVGSINPNDEAAFLETMLDMILENLEAGSEVIYETASNSNYVVDYQSYDEASAKRKLEEKQTEAA